MSSATAPPPKLRPLTAKELLFVDEVLAGKEQAEAHRLAYGGVSKGQARYELASRAANLPQVAAEIARRRARIAARVEAKLVWQVEEAVKSLQDIVKADGGLAAGIEVTQDNRIRAIGQASKILGWEAAQKVELSGGVSFLTLAGRGAGAGTPEAQKLAEMLNAAAAALRGNEG